MKKIVLLSVVFFLASQIMFAQEETDNYHYGNAFDVAYEISFPLGNLNDGAGASFVGTTARYEFAMGKRWVGTITSGYLSFADQDNQSYSVIPLQVGTKLRFLAGWYGMVETGYHFFSTSGTTKYDNPAEWGCSVGTGYEIPLGKLLSIDLAAKYQYNANNLSYWNTRAGLMFKF